MKRLLAAILAVSMLFSCMMTSAFAQGLTQAAQRSDVTYGISNGWNWEATTALKTHGEASVSKAFAANANLSHAGILCYYEPTSDVKVDASEADAFVFDFYVSDAAAIRNVMSEIEISSCGHPDVEERRYMGFVNDLIPGGLQDGWNTVVIPFEEMSDQFRDQPIDLTRINFFRQYFYALTTGEKKLTVAYDYLRFTKDGEVVAVLSDCEIGEVIPPEEPDEPVTPAGGIFKDIAADQNKGSTDQGWRNHKINLTHMTMDGHSAIGQTVIGARPLTDVRFHYYHTTPVDTTKYSHLEFDLYVEDAAKLPEGFALGIELSSSGLSDVEEISTEVFSLITGWNHIKIAFSDFYASSQEAYNPAAWNYTRLYFFNGNYLQGEQEELTIAIGEFNFTYSETQPEEPEEPFYSATVYFKDRANGQTLASAKTVTGKTGEQFVVNAPLVEGYTTTTDRLTVTIGTAASNYTIWYDKKEQSAPEPAIPIGGSDIPLTGGRWNGNCKTMTVDGISGIGNTYTSNMTIAGIYHEWTTDTPLDISDAKYLEFDLYISNAMAFKNTNLMFELTSSGTMDQEEIGITINSGWHGLRNGWNHIQWSLFDLLTHSAVGTFDPSNFNYFRFCNVRDIDLGGQELTVILANVKFTTGGATLDKDENGNVTQGKEHFVLTPVREDRTDPSNSPNKDYVVNITAGSNVEKFFADAKTEIVYKVPVTHASTARKILLTIKAGGQYWLQAGTDGQTWNDVYKFYDVELEQNGGMGNKSLLRATYTFDLTDAVIGADGKMDGNYIYIRLLDAYPAQGWGSNMFYEPAVFEIVYDLNGAQEPEQPDSPGNSFTPGYQNGELIMSDGTDVVDDIYAERVPGWYIAGDGQKLDVDYGVLVINGEKAIGNKIVGPKRGELFTSRFFFWADKAYDITKWTNVEFDLYLTKGSVANGAKLFVDFSSNENWIIDELARVEIRKNDWKDGWNHIKISLDQFNNGSVYASKFDPTNWDFVRVYFSGTAEGLPAAAYNLAEGEEYIIAIDNLKFTEPKPEKPATDHEIYEFIAVDGDADYLYFNDAGVAAGPSRYADTVKSFIYKYEVSKQIKKLQAITWTAGISGQYHIQASADAENWITIGKTEEKTDRRVVSFNASQLTTAVENTGVLYIKICDAVTSDGNGGRVWADTAVVLDIEYTPLSDTDLDATEDTRTEHSVPLWGANETWGGGWEIDNDNQTAGSGCVSVNLNGKSAVVANKVFDVPVNAQGMDTFEFEIYLSDLRILDFFTSANTAVEVTSSGVCDKEEINIVGGQLADWLQDHGVTVGWNHVAIPLSKMGTTSMSGAAFDISRINYLRFYIVGLQDVNEDYVIKLDNFRMTDALVADKTEFEKNHADLIVTLEKLSAYENVLSITADNFSYVSEQVRYAGSQVDSLTENERTIASSMGILSHLTKAETALNTYRDILKLEESLLNSIDDLAKKYAVITENNYEAALIDIPYARDQYQSLSQRDRQVIANAGYLAKLEAAEAVLDAYVPEESIPEDAPKLKVESVTTYVGGTVDVRVWIENNPGVIGMNLNMEYDSNQLELLAVADGGLMSGEKLFGDQLSQNPYTLVWEDAFATENNTANGVLVTFTFKVKDNATVGDIVLNLSYTTIINVALEHVAFATIDGVITVVDYISGDVNDDGNVNGLDVAVFRRHLANWEGYEEINESAADVNRDGVVDLIDVVILRRYLAGWDGVELK